MSLVNPRQPPPLRGTESSTDFIQGVSADSHFAYDPGATPRSGPPLSSCRRDLRPSVLVLGVYLADKPNCIEHIVSLLDSTESYRVVQRWISIGEISSSRRVQEVTLWHQPDRAFKFPLINRLLTQEPLGDYEYLIVIDDDVQLPENFLRHFLAAQTSLDFRVAQPARTANSYVDHPIVVQQAEIFARQTQWVEVGPVVSIHRSVFDVLLPFDERSPMGWGYENVWAYELWTRGLKMGIIDAFPVEHSLRLPHAYYSWTEADAACRGLLASRPHLPQDRCQQVLAEIENTPQDLAAIMWQKTSSWRKQGSGHQVLSVVLACREGSDARPTLTSLARQTFRDFDIIVSYDHGRGANWARNRGFDLVDTPFVLFSDDDILWEPQALELMMAALELHPEASYTYGSYSIPEIGTQCDHPFDAERLRRHNFISTMSIIRTADFPGFDESIRRFQDWDVWLTMLQRGQIGVHCGSHIFQTRLRPGITYGGELTVEEATQVIRKKHAIARR
jgi:hypothetical protein